MSLGTGASLTSAWYLHTCEVCFDSNIVWQSRFNSIDETSLSHSNGYPLLCTFA